MSSFKAKLWVRGAQTSCPLCTPRRNPARKLELLFAKILHDAHRGADTLELLEKLGERLLNLLVWIKDDAVLRIVIEANRQRFPQLATPCLALDSAQQTGAENMEFCL